MANLFLKWFVLSLEEGRGCDFDTAVDEVVEGRVERRVLPVPVSFVHQVGQIQLTLPRERAEVFVMLEEVQQLGGVGHPEGESAGDGLLPLQRNIAAVSC